MTELLDKTAKVTTKWNSGNFLVVEWLGLWPFIAEVLGLIPSQGTKIP